MEGVGARLGRSSTRYGPATTFSGKVRKWKKTWVPLSNPSSNNASSNASSGNNTTTNGNTPSGLLLYKWAPLTNGSSTANNGDAQEQPTKKRKYRYVPVYTIEEEDAKQENDTKSEDETNNNTPDGDDNANSNDAEMEDTPASDIGRDSEKGGNGTDLNLNLGLNDGENDGDLNMN